MYKRTLLKILPAVIILIVLFVVLIPGEALGWSAVVGNRTHKDIDEAAYEFLSNDPAFQNVKFPTLDAIVNNDYVNLDRTGTGPDVIGKSNCSAHYYNPRLEAVQHELAVPGAGGGPDAVKEQFVKLVDALKSGNAAETAHAASWVAHYAADLYTPYHTQGTYRADILRRYQAAGG